MRKHSARLERRGELAEARTRGQFLAPQFADHPERLARFEREAKLLATLNHSNIAAVYGFQSHGSLRFVVMEYVEGEDLA